MSKVEKKNVERSITYVMCDIFDGVFFQISKHAGSQKNPKVLAESLNWLSDAIKGFGFKYVYDFLIFLPAMNCWCLPERNSSCPHCMLKHCIKIGFKREHMFTVFLMSFVHM